MTEAQILRLIRNAQQSSPKRGARIELPAEPKEVEDEYFADPYRPRLTPKAFLVWAFLLRRTDPESRIASASYRDIRRGTGVHSAGLIRSALLELAHYGYCKGGLEPTGPGLPRNYKIPLHIGSEATYPSYARKVFLEAERPKRICGTARRKLRQAMQQAQIGPVQPQSDPAAAPSEPSTVHCAPRTVPPEPSTALTGLPLAMIERQTPTPEPRPGALDEIVKILEQASSTVSAKVNQLFPDAPQAESSGDLQLQQAIAQVDREIAQAIKSSKE